MSVCGGEGGGHAVVRGGRKGAAISVAISTLYTPTLNPAMDNCRRVEQRQGCAQTWSGGEVQGGRGQL